MLFEWSKGQIRFTRSWHDPFDAKSLKIWDKFLLRKYWNLMIASRLLSWYLNETKYSKYTESLKA